jgi:5-methylcytosine-specific restriction endonuclease McrA
MSYKRYLQGDHWKELRETKLIESNGRCQKCKRTSNLQVHHLTYDRKGHERLTDLMVLCERCHEKEHNLFPVYVDDWKPSPKLIHKSKKNKRVESERPIHPLFKYVKPMYDGIIT